MSTGVTVPGGGGTNYVFQITGAHTLGMAQQFVDDLQAGLDGGTATETVVTNPGDLVQLAGTGNFVVDVADDSTVVGSGMDDQVLFGATNGATYQDQGGNNRVIFAQGNNSYQGDAAATSGIDTIVAGSGNDTIATGTNQALIATGTGSAFIVLNDQIGPGQGDVVAADDGQNTIVARGVSDAVFMTAPGQTVFGGAVAGANTTVVIGADTGGAGPSQDVIVAGDGKTTVFDHIGGTQLYTGNGQSAYISGVGVAASVVAAGAGETVIFGNTGANIAFNATSTSTGTNLLVAGSGNETLMGAYSSSALTIYAGQSSDAGTAGGIADQISGGAGNDTIFSGDGQDTLLGGGGQNVFVIEKTATGHADIVLGDFGASTGNLVTFAGYSNQEIANALAGASTVGGTSSHPAGVEITLNDGTQVVFAGITSLNGHVI